MAMEYIIGIANSINQHCVYQCHQARINIHIQPFIYSLTTSIWTFYSASDLTTKCFLYTYLTTTQDVSVCSALATRDRLTVRASVRRGLWWRLPSETRGTARTSELSHARR